MSGRHVTETVTLQTYSLQIIGPNDGQELVAIQSAVKVRSMIREAEENLTDLLPEGYSARISEWDAEEDYISDNQKRREAGKRQDEARRHENFKSSPSQPGDYR